MEEFQPIEINGDSPPSQTGDFKAVCFKLALLVTAFFVSRVVCFVFVVYLKQNYAEQIGVTGFYILQLFIQGIFLYGIPILTGLYLFGYGNVKGIYRKPPRVIKAIGNFPALYGISQIANILALVVFYIYARIKESGLDEEAVERSFAPMESALPPNSYCGIAFFVFAVFCAAIFEEILCRGIMLNALKPYGSGFAILITGFIFGSLHGNVHQFIYTFAAGIMLAYIAVHTGSILCSSILHGMYNAVSSVVMLFISTSTIRDYIDAGVAEELTEAVPPDTVSDGGMMIIAAFGMIVVMIICLIATGIVLGVRKLMRFKYFKESLPKTTFTEISSRKKTAIFFTSFPAVIMLILIIDSFAGDLIASKIFEMIIK